MKTYVLLLRGINVGGQNKVPMRQLQECLEQLGFLNVTTYIASGNVILRSEKKPADVRALVEVTLPKAFKLKGELVKVHMLTLKQLQHIVDNKPAGFGDRPDEYHSDLIFPIDLKLAVAMTVFDPREGVDQIWAGKGVIYSQRLSALRTKTRLNVAMASPLFKSMTMRSWNTMIKLLEMTVRMEEES